MTLLCVLLLMTAWAGYVAAADIYVSPTGKDTADCGAASEPCRTLPYAISKSRPNGVIKLDSSRGPYTDLGANYSAIRHDLTILASNPDVLATLKCGDHGNRLFNITASRGSNATVFLSRIKIQNCRDEADPHSGVILLRDASMVVKNCSFVNNGVIWSTGAGVGEGSPPCEWASLSLANSELRANGHQRPRMGYGVHLRDCAKVKVLVSQSLFAGTSLLVYPRHDLALTVDQSVIDGTSLGAVSMRVSLGAHDNRVFIKNTNITDHRFLKTSPLTIYQYNKGARSRVSFKHVTFQGNVMGLTSGGALSIIAPFAGKRPMPIHIDFNSCRFVTNSAKTMGGAVYIKGVAGVTFNACVFRNNSAAMGGGAVAVAGAEHVSFTNTEFVGNSAVNGAAGMKTPGQGGAIRTTDTDLLLNHCQLINNTGLYEGSALWADEAKAVSIQNCTFEVSAASAALTAFHSVMALRKCAVASGNATAQSSVSHNVFRVVAADQTVGVLDVRQPALAAGDNQVWCPAGFTVTYSQVKTEDSMNNVHAAVTCQPCPLGTYNMRPPVLHKALSGAAGYGVNGSCSPCPPEGRCLGGKMLPLPGYWARFGKRKRHWPHTYDGGNPEQLTAYYEDRSRATYSTELVTFYMCPEGFCQDADVTTDNDPAHGCQNHNCCQGNRSGTLCGKCAGSDYSYHVGQGGCLPGSECRSDATAALGFCALFAVVYIIIIMSYSRLCVTFSFTSEQTPDPGEPGVHRARVPGEREDRHALINGDADPETPPEQDEDAQPQGEPPREEGCTMAQTTPGHPVTGKTVYIQETSLLVVDLIICTQLLGVAHGFPFPLRSLPRAIAAPPLSILNLQVPFTLITRLCFHGDLAAVGEAVLRLSSGGFLVLAHVFLLIAHLTCECCLRRRRDNPDNYRVSRLSEVSYWSYCVTLALSHVPLAQASMEILHCVPVGYTSVLFRAGEVGCYQPWQTALAVYFSLVMLPLGLTLWAGMVLAKRGFITRGQLALLPFMSLIVLFRWLCMFRYRFLSYAMTSPALPTPKPNRPGPQPAPTPTPSPARKGGPVLLVLSVLLSVVVSGQLGHLPLIRGVVVTILLSVTVLIRHETKPFWLYRTPTCRGVATSFWAAIPVISLLATCNAVAYQLAASPALISPLQVGSDWLLACVVLAASGAIVTCLVVIIVLCVKSHLSQ